MQDGLRADGCEIKLKIINRNASNREDEASARF